MDYVSELNIVGGHVALDLVNTVHPRTQDRQPATDHLTTAEALLAWARRVDLLTAGEAADVTQAWRRRGTGQRALQAVLEIREASYDALLAELGTPQSADAALELLRDRWAAAIGRSVLRSSADRGIDRHGGDRLYVGTDPRLLIPDRLANAAAELLRTLDTDQLKACPLEEGGCGFLFLDRSHNRTRRWCSMQDCGARAKARRLAARRRADRARSSTAPSPANQ